MAQNRIRAQKKLAPFSFISLVLLALVFSACQKPEDDIQPNFSSIWDKKLSKSCANCHQPGGSAWEDYNIKVDFRDKASTYSWLVSDKVVSNPNCTSIKIVTPWIPEQSYLAGLLISAYNKNNFGGQLGCKPDVEHIESLYASEKEQQAILTWIKEGAQNN